jgi:hypothetical protein
MVTGLTTEGKVASFGGIVQSVENGHREYPGYPVPEPVTCLLGSAPASAYRVQRDHRQQPIHASQP